VSRWIREEAEKEEAGPSDVFVYLVEALCRTYGARRIFWAVYPALTRWANLCRAYGACLGGKGRFLRTADRWRQSGDWRSREKNAGLKAPFVPQGKPALHVNLRQEQIPRTSLGMTT
jgi:hypothetical protein